VTDLGSSPARASRTRAWTEPGVVVARERALSSIRWLGLAWGVIQLLALDLPSGADVNLAPVLAGFTLLAGANLAGIRLAGRLNTASGARIVGAVGFAVDSAAVLLLTWGFSDSTAIFIWQLLLLIPIDGAFRLRLPGALVGWGLVAVGYVTVYAPNVDLPALDAGVIVFNLGFALILALAVGMIARAEAGIRAELARTVDAYDRVRSWRDRVNSTLAHDLRAPLTTIRGVATTLRDHPDLDDALRTRLVGTLDRQATRVLMLADELLDVARLEQGRFQLQRREVDVAEIVTDAVAAAPRPELVDIVVTPGLRATVDPVRTGQVVANLVANAFAHGAPPVEVRADRDDESLRITVTDHGSGVPARERQEMFDAYSRGDGEGELGLGLWIVSSVAAAHGGRVDYDDAAAGGASFVVRLPLTAPASRIAPTQWADQTPRS
jgi:signal transduction histidine kinase